MGEGDKQFKKHALFILDNSLNNKKIKINIINKVLFFRIKTKTVYHGSLIIIGTHRRQEVQDIRILQEIPTILYILFNVIQFRFC